jgi:hypothetical protein
VGYNDPSKPDVDPLHEWEFRSGLDRYIWIWGMLCAYFHPRYEKALVWLDEINQQTATIIRGFIVAGRTLVAVHSSPDRVSACLDRESTQSDLQLLWPLIDLPARTVIHPS